MSLLAYLPLAIIAALCSLAAYRLAAQKGRGAKRWMVATVLFGPLTLIPLWILARRRTAG